MNKKIINKIGKGCKFFAICLSAVFIFSSVQTAKGGTGTLSSSNPAVSAATTCAGTVLTPIYNFVIDATGNGPTPTFSGLNFTTTGTYIASDFTKFQLWYNFSNSLSGATQLSSNLTPTAPGTQTFAAFSLAMPTPSTYYFFITTDVAAAPVNNHTITVSALTTANMTFSSGTKAGSAFAGGTQTISTTLSPVSVIIAGATNCTGISVTFTATPTNGGSSPFYQWKVNGANIGGATSATYTTATLASGDIVTCVLTSNQTCITGNPATSNSLTMTPAPMVYNTSVTTQNATTQPAYPGTANTEIIGVEVLACFLHPQFPISSGIGPGYVLPDS